jgi:glycosyltransferase A (GT-A) superfamily protein (DUF2064 family)
MTHPQASTVQILVFAKQPVPGRVKTRLCPPCTPEQAAAVAAAALDDTIAAVTATPARRRTLVISGSYRTPPDWAVCTQRGSGMAERLAAAFADTALPGVASVLIGMDTPHVTPQLLAEVAGGLADADAVLGPADDGGWWALALAQPRHAAALRGVPMSTSYTAVLTAAALRRRGLTLRWASQLSDVDTVTDAWTVAQARPRGRFAAAVRTHITAPATDRWSG